MKFITILLALTSFNVLGTTKKEMLQLCSDIAKKNIKIQYFSNPSKMTLIDFTSWLSKEEFQNNETIWHYTHVSNVKLDNNEYYSWDFHSTLIPKNNNCELLSISKTFETRIYPCLESRCEEDDNSD